MADDDLTPVAPKRRRARRRKAAAPITDASSADATIVPVSGAGQDVIEGISPVGAEAPRLSAVGRIEGDQVRVDMGAVGAIRADQVSVDRGAVGAVLADRVEVSRGYARSILARQVQIDRGGARVVVAADVRAQQSAVMFLVARRVSGDVRVLLDWRGALAFGAVTGFVLALLARGRRKPG
jgi:hypothetical protein